MDLVDLLKRPEGKTLEFKRDLSSPDGALNTVAGRLRRPQLYRQGDSRRHGGALSRPRTRA